MTDPPPPSRLSSPHLARAVCIAVVAVAAVLFVGTAVSTSWARLAALRTVEPYAWAVHEQLMYNFGVHGQWRQVIHSGYDDAWTWSGHRAGTLVVMAWLYALSPSALWSSVLMIVGLAAGAVPAALIGRQALRSDWGLALGGLLYLGAPAVLATSLQDYQDLCFATSFLLVTLWSMQARHWAWPLLGAAIGVLPREECVPLVLACALVTFEVHPLAGARWKRWLLNVGLATLVAGAYAGWAQWAYPLSTQPGQGHDTPLVNALYTVFQPDVLERLPGAGSIQGFYDLTWAPLGLLALLSPWTALPAAGLLFMHMTVPDGHGVHRYWSGHAHHMAPVLPFILAASILGAGRLLRAVAALRPARLPGLGRALALVLALAALGYNAWWLRAWGDSFQLVWAPWPQDPGYRHPVWQLVDQLPPDAVPVVSVSHAIAVSNRSDSYTYEESIPDKAFHQGLGVADHMIVSTQVGDAVRWALAQPGAEQVAEVDGYLLIRWNKGLDPTLPISWRGWPRPPQWTPPGHRFEQVPGVPPFGR